MSKREKRKHQHVTLQQDLQNDFNENRERHYREQLIALQTDMNLVSQADPYGPDPLDDTPDGIMRQIESSAYGTPYQSELSSLAGKWYTEFVGEVNEAKEAKELELIRLKVSERATYSNMMLIATGKSRSTTRAIEIRMRLQITSGGRRMRIYDQYS